MNIPKQMTLMFLSVLLIASFVLSSSEANEYISKYDVAGAVRQSKIPTSIKDIIFDESTGYLIIQTKTKAVYLFTNESEYNCVENKCVSVILLSKGESFEYLFSVYVPKNMIPEVDFCEICPAKNCVFIHDEMCLIFKN